MSLTPELCPWVDRAFEIWRFELPHHPRDPVRWLVLILAGGFSDPSTWVPGRLNALSGVVNSATAPSVAFPQNGLHSAPCSQVPCA